MSAWETVGSTYVEATTAVLPLQRIVTFGIGLLASIAIDAQTHHSILETVSKLELWKLTSLSVGPLAQATVGNVLFGFALVVAAWVISRSLLWAVFAIAARSTDLWSRAKGAKHSQVEQSLMKPAERQTAAALLEEALAETKARLKVISAFAELSFGISVACSFGFVWGNVLDILSGMLFFVIAVSLHVAAVRVFLSDYFGPALLKAQLQGRDPPTPLSAR